MLPNEPVLLPRYELLGEPLDPGDRDALDTDAIIRFIRRSWRLWLMWLSVGLCASIAFGVLLPSYFTSDATILVEDRISRPSGAWANGANAADQAYVESQVLILQSDEVLGRVVDRKRLTQDAEFGKPADSVRALIIRSIRWLLSSGANVSPEERHATIIRVRRALSVRRIGTSDAVEVGFTSRSPVRAAEIANAVVRSYIDGRLELKRQAHEDAASRLRERLGELRKKAFAIRPPQAFSVTGPEAGERSRARFRELQDNTETYRAMYNSLLQREDGASDAQFTSIDARVITPAEPPLARSSPGAILVIAIIAVAGAAGVGHALLREIMDHSLRTVEDVQRSTGLDHIAGVPSINGDAWEALEAPTGGLQPAYVKASLGLNEALGKVLVRVQGGQNRRSGFLTGVVAPIGGSGASSVAAHLARAIAESGQKTLLVDANWRKPSAALAMLNAAPGRKLGRGITTIELGPERLDVLVLRATAPVSELNASLSIVATIQHLQAEYDCVVIDFHSADQAADLEASMAFINEVIVVAEARRTTSESLGGLLRMLPREKLSAVILNKI